MSTSSTTQSNAGYWYLNRDKLAAGQIFRTLKGSMVKLSRQVEGDSAKWHVADWHNGWSDCGSTIEPSELSGLQLPEPEVGGGNSRADGHRFMVSPDGTKTGWFHPDDIAARAADWTDCTDMSNDECHAFIVERQGARLQVVGVTVGA